jgi:hypothetical protein
MTHFKNLLLILPLTLIVGCGDGEDDGRNDYGALSSGKLRSCEYVRDVVAFNPDINVKNVASCITFSGSGYDFLPYDSTTGFCTSDLDQPNPVASCKKTGSRGECVLFPGYETEQRYRFYLNDLEKERGFCLSGDFAGQEFIED